MISEQDRLTLAAARTDFLAFRRLVYAELNPGRPFHDNWHHGAIAYQLEQVRAGDCRRLIINVPPRSLKSIMVSVAFVAFLLGHDPGLKVFVVSHSSELARQHARDFRKIVESRWYQLAFPTMRIARTGDRLFETVTTMGGFRLATSTGASVTGKGADLIIIDDPNRAEDALSQSGREAVNSYYDLTLFNRLNDKQTGAIVLVMQRLHADDLTGHVLEQENWTRLVIPAIATSDDVFRTGPRPTDLHRRQSGDILQPSRDNMDVLNSLRAVMGSMQFEAQYQQNPLPAEGNLIRRSWLKHYQEAPEDYEFLVASWDAAMTTEEAADYSVGTVWGLNRSQFYLLDLVRGRFEYPDLRAEVLNLHHKWNVHQTIIEKAGIGHGLVQDLRRNSNIRPIGIVPKFAKDARLAAQSAKFEAAQVFLPLDAPWLGAYCEELLAFPYGRHDDQVDSTSQALHYLSSKQVRPAATSRPRTRVRPPGRLRSSRQHPTRA